VVWTCGHTVPASYTPRVYLAHDAGIRIPSGCRCRAHGHTRRIVALHARSREVHDFGIRKPFPVGYLVDLEPVYVPRLIRFIMEHGDVILRRAGNHACPAADTSIQVNDHPISSVLGIVFAFHN